ncbi:hypothetical protein VL04_00660 [Chromobacterium violaceum]|nr:hypothetical protein VK93_19330 [Chromobacterium violaceum]KMN86571.1 hypothetical protein VL02_07555 [Chromobacterium violaceum]KMN92062.1 hypothetical protein VL04_00660 [Chromobacterium violaceum]KMO04195.1 hypothetical protein VL16_10170 [Chromobacterium violaceum]
MQSSLHCSSVLIFYFNSIRINDRVLTPPTPPFLINQPLLNTLQPNIKILQNQNQILPIIILQQITLKFLTSPLYQAM